MATPVGLILKVHNYNCKIFCEKQYLIDIFKDIDILFYLKLMQIRMYYLIKNRRNAGKLEMRGKSFFREIRYISKFEVLIISTFDWKTFGWKNSELQVAASDKTDFQFIIIINEDFTHLNNL